MQSVTSLVCCCVSIVSAASCAAGDARPVEPHIAFGTIAEGGFVSYVEEGRDSRAGLAWYYGDFSADVVKPLRAVRPREAEVMSQLPVFLDMYSSSALPPGKAPKCWRIHGDYFWAAFLYAPGSAAEEELIIRMAFGKQRAIKEDVSTNQESVETHDRTTWFAQERHVSRKDVLWERLSRSSPQQLQIVSSGDMLWMSFHLWSSGNRLFEYDILPAGSSRLLVPVFVNDKMQLWQYDFTPGRWKYGPSSGKEGSVADVWLGKWTRQVEFPVDFHEPFHVVAIPQGVAFVTDSGRSYVAEKDADGSWTSRAVWHDESRPLIAMVDVPDQNQCYAFGKDFYFLLSSKPEPVECRDVTRHRTDHGEPLRTSWECAKVLYENGRVAIPKKEPSTTGQ